MNPYALEKLIGSVTERDSYLSRQEMEFIAESNAIEDEYTFPAFHFACEAWRFARDLYSIDPSSIRKIHNILMEEVNPKIAGKFRKCNVRVGSWNAPIPGTINRLIEIFVDEFNMPLIGSRPVKALQCKDMHVRFEKIHPFEDGNGRVGRILYNLHRKINKLPIHVIHTGEEQRKYYRWFHE